MPVVGFLRSYANETKMQHIKLLDLPHLSVPISSDDITTLIPLVVSGIFSESTLVGDIRDVERYSR